MAIQQDFLVKNGMVVRNTATFSTIESLQTTGTQVATVLPTLNLNFAASSTLDPRITFSRASGATYLDKNGYMQYAANDVPRFDYDTVNTGTIRGLLIEESRTNLVVNSNTVGTGGWNYQTGANDSAYIFNADIAPDGTKTATLLYATTSTLSYPNFLQYLNVNTNTSYTGSFFVKPTNGKTTVSYSLYDVATNLNCLYLLYNFSTNSFSTSTTGNTTTFTVIPTVQQYPNGWYRIQSTWLFNSGPTRTIQYKLNLDSSGSPTVGSGLLLWGAQVEAGTFATSLIPTNTASATRAGDSASMLGQNFLSWFTQAQGTVYAEWYQYFGGGGNVYTTPGLWGVTDSSLGTYNGYGIRIDYGTINNQNIAFIGRQSLNSNASITFLYVGPLSAINTGTYKSISGWDANNQNISIQGYAPNIYGTNPTGRVLTQMNSLLIGNQNVGGAPTQLNGAIRRLVFWPQLLTPSQFQSLTTATSFIGANPANVQSPTRTANTSDFTVKQGIVVRSNLEVPDVDKLYATTATRPVQQATLNLNFLTGTLDPRIQFTRSSGATYIGSDGLIKYSAPNSPRFQYSSTSTGTCLGLLIEEQRTNYYTSSTDYFQSLSGGYTFWDGSFGFRNILSGINITTVYALSLYLKVNQYYTGHSMMVDLGDGPTTLNKALSTFTTGTWVRFVGTGLCVNSGLFADIRLQNLGPGALAAGSFSGPPGATTPVTRNYGISPDGNRTSTRIVVNNTTTGAILSDIEIWGFQVEPGQFSTSLIPTGSISATRTADSATITGQNFLKWYNPKQGTVYAEGAISPGFSGFSPVLTIEDAPGNNVVGLYQYIGLFGGTIRWATGAQLGDPLTSIPGGAVTGTNYKLALTVAAGNYYSVWNSVVGASITDQRVPTSVDRMLIGASNSGYLNSTLKRITYYPTQLSTATLQILTTASIY